ncbi:MAG: hypothetical protein ACLSVD_12560 [Eggerthellaceae bacterium]
MNPQNAGAYAATGVTAWPLRLLFRQALDMSVRMRRCRLAPDVRSFGGCAVTPKPRFRNIPRLWATTHPPPPVFCMVVASGEFS